MKNNFEQFNKIIDTVKRITNCTEDKGIECACEIMEIVGWDAPPIAEDETCAEILADLPEELREIFTCC